MTDENRTPIPIDEPHLPLDDTITKRVLEAMRPTRITDPEAVASELKRTIESVAALSPGESYVRNAEKAANSFHSSMVEDMRRAAEEVRKASLGVDYSLALVPQFNSSRNHTGFPSDVLSSMRPAPSADQVTETNNRLDELLEQIAALVGVAKQQAQLTQALNTSSETTLEYARKTGADTKASTDLARDTVRLTRWAIWIAVLSPILSALIGIGVSVYLDRRNSMANEERAKAEQSLRQQEIRILDAISQRLATQTPASVVLPPKRVRQR